MFGEVGEVVDVHIPKDRETGRPRGFAFVRFATQEHAAQAVEQFHGRELAGRALRLDIAEDRPRSPRPKRDFNSDRGGRSDFGGGRGRDSGRGRDRFADPAGGRGELGPPPEDFAQDFGRDTYSRDDYDQDEEGPGRGRGGRSFDKPKRPKGSRRGLRAKKRSL